MDATLTEELAAVRRELAQIKSSQEATQLTLSKLFAVHAYVPPVIPTVLSCHQVESGMASTPSITEIGRADVKEEKLETKINGSKQLVERSAEQPEKPKTEISGSQLPVAIHHPKRQSTHVEEREKARREKRLQKVLDINGAHQAKRTALEDAEKVRTWLGDRHHRELELDAAMFVVIVANAFFIGVSIDLDKGERGWLILNLAFSCIFWLELISKVVLFGCRGYFFGEGWKTNIFDAFLVVLDTAQLAAEQLGASAKEEVGVDASIFRLLKIFRLTRMLRVLRWEGFKDLLAMVQGVLAGVSTLAWAMLLFFLMIYTVALVCRTLLAGNDKIFMYFDTLPRSIFTVFRCSFGDCSTAGGTPIIELLSSSHAWVVQFAYILFLFFTVIGLFNIISAIFVDSTMNYAQTHAIRQRNERLDNEELFAVNVSTFIRCCLEKGKASDDLTPCLPMTGESFDLLRTVKFSSQAVLETLQEEEVIEALGLLDIDHNDCKKLNDILDPDRDGEIPVPDMVTGLMRIRGMPSRGDIVCIDLMMRSLQKTVARIEQMISESIHIGERQASHDKAPRNNDSQAVREFPGTSALRAQSGLTLSDPSPTYV